MVAVAGMDGGWRRGCDWMSEAVGEIGCDWMSEAGGEMTAGGASGTVVRWGG